MLEGRKVNRSSRILALFVFSAVLSLSVAVFRASAFPTAYFATISPCDGAGNVKTTFGSTEFVYAEGVGYAPFEQITLRVIPNEAPYSTAFSVCNTVATADGSGHLSPVKLCVLVPGKYDVWADRNSNGVLELAPTDPIDGSIRPEPVAGLGTCYVGLFVVPEYWLGTISGLAACLGAFGIFFLSKRKHKIA